MNLKYVKGSYMDEIMYEAGLSCLPSMASKKVMKRKHSSTVKKFGTGFWRTAPVSSLMRR